MKSINAILIGLVLFLLAYSVCFWFDRMPKFYPVLETISFVPIKDGIAVKFVGSAVVGAVAGLVGFCIGLALPKRATVPVHLLTWAVMIVACVYLVGREAGEYIFHLW